MLITVWLGCAVIAALIASSKGRSAGGWLFMGIILGIFAVVIIAVLPKIEPPSPPQKQCPDCGETVLSVANVCKHCGHRFDTEPQQLSYTGQQSRNAR